jgi:hypothetical protein
MFTRFRNRCGRFAMAKLSDLLINEREVDESVLAQGLAGIVGVTEAGTVRPLEGWDRLNERGKLLALLLGLMAAEIMGKRQRVGITPTEAAALAGVAEGTAKRTLRELLTHRLVEQEGRGRYAVSTVAMRAALRDMSAGRQRHARP